MFCDYIFHVTATKLYHPEHFSGDVTLFCGLAYRPPTLESQDPVESQQAPAIRRFALRSALHVIAQMFAFFVRAVGFLGGTPGCFGTHHEQVPETDVAVNGG